MKVMVITIASEWFYSWIISTINQTGARLRRLLEPDMLTFWPGRFLLGWRSRWWWLVFFGFHTGQDGEHCGSRVVERCVQLAGSRRHGGLLLGWTVLAGIGAPLSTHHCCWTGVTAASLRWGRQIHLSSRPKVKKKLVSYCPPSSQRINTNRFVTWGEQGSLLFFKLVLAGFFVSTEEFSASSTGGEASPRLLVGLLATEPFRLGKDRTPLSGKPPSLSPRRRRARNLS